MHVLPYLESEVSTLPGHVMIAWDKFPLVAGDRPIRRWLQFTANIGGATNTVTAYGRAAENHLRFLELVGAVPLTTRADLVAVCSGDLHDRSNLRDAKLVHLVFGVGLANATVQQWVVAGRTPR